MRINLRINSRPSLTVFVSCSMFNDYVLFRNGPRLRLHKAGFFLGVKALASQIFKSLTSVSAL